MAPSALAQSDPLAQPPGGVDFRTLNYGETGFNASGRAICIVRPGTSARAGLNAAIPDVAKILGVKPTLTSGFVDSKTDHGGGANFTATGISLVLHPRNPLAPTVHANFRFLTKGEKWWFGGGGDLTPMRLESAAAIEDAAAFHAALEAACDRHDPACYADFKAWCDRYFYLPHRGEARGAGGIFFDHYFSGDAARDFAFVRDVGLAFLAAYPEIVRRRMGTPWSEAERAHQLVRRGRYVEFNLLHDRGTLFGLKTGGNVEAILMSLPPEVRWP